MQKIDQTNCRAIAESFVNSVDDEACIALLMRMHCAFGDIQKMLRTSKVSRYRFEYAVQGGRIDLVLFHADGGISLVEIKGRNSTRDVVAGIGQLFFYEAAFCESQPKAKRPIYINKYLVSPIEGENANRVSKACDLAGINFLQYAPVNLIKEHRDSCVAKWCGGGS